MAELDYDRLAETLANAIRQSNETTGGRRSTGSNPEDLINSAKRFKETLSSATNQTKAWNDFLKNGRVSYIDATDEIENFNSAIKKSVTAEQKRELENQRNQLQASAAWANSRRSFVNAVSTMSSAGVNFAKDLIGATKDVVTAMLGQGSDTRMFTSIFSAGVRIVSGAATGLGQVFGGLGQVVGSLVSRWFPLLGSTIGGVTGAIGRAFGGLVGMVGGVAVAAFELLTGVVDEYIKTFQTMNRAGAMYAGGMSEMIDTANKAGLTVGQFAKIVSQSAEDIAKAGGGVVNGSKRLAAGLAAGGSELRRELLNLGYNVEEQGTLMAETMGRMAGSAGRMQATDKEIAEQTRQYAYNLRLVAEFTGQDAKRRAEQARKDMDILAFNQVLNDLAPKQRDQVRQAVEGLADDTVRRMVIQYATLGTLTGELAKVAAVTPEAANLARKLAAGVKQGTLTTDQALEMQRDSAGTIQKQANQNRDIAIAGAYVTNSAVRETAIANNEMMKNYQILGSMTEEEFKKRKEEAAKQGKTVDKIDPITNLMTTIQEQAQRLRVLVESTIKDLLTQFANVLAENVTKIADGIENLAKALNPAELGSTIDKVIKNLGQIGTDVLGKIKGADSKGMGETAGTYAGYALGGLLGYKVGGTLADKILDKIPFGKNPAVGTAAGMAMGITNVRIMGPDGSPQKPFSVVILNNIGGAVPGGIGTGPPGRPQPDTTPNKTPPVILGPDGKPLPPKPEPAAPKPATAGTPPKPEPAEPKSTKSTTTPRTPPVAAPAPQTATPSKLGTYGKLAGSLVGRIGGVFGGGILGSMALGWLGSLAGEKLGELVESVYQSFINEGNLEGRASGGIVVKGRPYIVGELGKEIFVPDENGKIIPNNMITETATNLPPLELQRMIGEQRNAGNILKEQTDLYKLAVQQQEQMLRTLSEMKSISQQMLHNLT